MIHLMELPNPDDLNGRPEHGGRDRHFCIGIDAGGVEPLMQRLDKAGAALPLLLTHLLDMYCDAVSCVIMLAYQRVE